MADGETGPFIERARASDRYVVSMSDQTPQQIREYCRAWSQRAAAHQRMESLRIGTSHVYQASPLASVCDDIETADHAQLTSVVAGLTVCMVQPGEAFAGYGRDYRLVWAWCAELLVGRGRGASFGVEFHVPRLLTAAVDAMLARSIPDDAPGVGRHARELVNEHVALVAYLAFPLLEELLRAACRRHFNDDGRITAAFDTPGDDRQRHLYARGGTCSSVGDLLWLYRHHYAPKEIAACLDEVDNYLAVIVPGGTTGFRILRQWRNDTMHGTTALPTIGAVALNLAIIVALADKENDYADAVAKVVARRTPGSGLPRFYPPEDELTGRRLD